MATPMKELTELTELVPYSQEIKEAVYALGRLRTLALGYAPEATKNYSLSDCTKSWAENEDGVKAFDSIVSFPPLGLMVPVTKEMGIKWPAKMISLEDYFLCKGSDSLNPGGHLIGVLANGVSKTWTVYFLFIMKRTRNMDWHR